MSDSLSDSASATNRDEGTEIWAVGGGKGGTGKTFILCQLANDLASQGYRVILVDTDFGGANIHSYLGLKKPEKTLNAFFENNMDLEDLLLDTPIKNVRVIAGDHNAISTDSMKYSQKLKFLRRIKRLQADYILLDLGGGSNFNTIDVFLLADRMLVVTIPEITAIENLFHFIKNVYFRKLNFLLGVYGLKNSAKNIWRNRKDYGITGIIDLVEFIKGTSENVKQILDEELRKFSVFIILNKVRNATEILKGFSIKSICIKFLGVDTVYTGYISYDPQLWKGLSIIYSAPQFKISYRTQSEINRVTRNILDGTQIKIDSVKDV